MTWHYDPLLCGRPASYWIEEKGGRHILMRDDAVAAIVFKFDEEWPWLIGICKNGVRYVVCGISFTELANAKETADAIVCGVEVDLIPVLDWSSHAGLYAS